jgi:thiol-disulfide isomerase/thioredoxin
MVCFYADWCGACHQWMPALEILAKNDPNVNLVKIDIVKWGNPVATQHKVNREPRVLIYDRQGRQVGTPTHQFPKIVKFVDGALRKRS